MNLYQINLPCLTNKGESYALDAELWEYKAEAVAGGFTRLPNVEGVWLDAEAGKRYVDTLRVYQVACEPEQWSELCAFAKRRFSDQVCLFVAKLGKAELI